MMPCMSIVELENESLRSRYAAIKKAAKLLAYEVERNCVRCESRKEMFALVDAIKTMTRK